MVFYKPHFSLKECHLIQNEIRKCIPLTTVKWFPSYAKRMAHASVFTENKNTRHTLSIISMYYVWRSGDASEYFMKRAGRRLYPMRRLVVRSRTIIRCLIPRLRDFTRSYYKTSYQILKRDPVISLLLPNFICIQQAKLMPWFIAVVDVLDYSHRQSYSLFWFFYFHILYSHTYFALDFVTLQWRHNGSDKVSNHRRLGCLLYRLFRRRSKKTSKLRVTSLCEGNSPVTDEFPSQRASNAENVSIWWRHHDILVHHIVLRYVCQVIKIYNLIYIKVAKWMDLSNTSSLIVNEKRHCPPYSLFCYA